MRLRSVGLVFCFATIFVAATCKKSGDSGGSSNPGCQNGINAGCTAEIMCPSDQTCDIPTGNCICNVGAGGAGGGGAGGGGAGGVAGAGGGGGAGGSGGSVSCAAAGDACSDDSDCCEGLSCDPGSGTCG